MLADLTSWLANAPTHSFSPKTRAVASPEYPDMPRQFSMTSPTIPPHSILSSLPSLSAQREHVRPHHTWKKNLPGLGTKGRKRYNDESLHGILCPRDEEPRMLLVPGSVGRGLGGRTESLASVWAERKAKPFRHHHQGTREPSAQIRSRHCAPRYSLHSSWMCLSEGGLSAIRVELMMVESSRGSDRTYDSLSSLCAFFRYSSRCARSNHTYSVQL